MARLRDDQTFGEALRAQRLAAAALPATIEAFPEVMGEPVKPPRRRRDHIQREAKARLRELTMANQISTGTRSRQPVVEDSRSVAAEWGDGPLDADEDTKRVSRQEVGGANPPIGRDVAQQESASQIPASVFLREP